MPRDALRSWLETMVRATDERLPEPPVELTAWLDQSDPLIAALGEHALQDGPWTLPPSMEDPETTARVAKLFRILVASAGVETWRGRHDLASRRLDAAWTLQGSLATATGFAYVGSQLLGALRIARVQDNREWMERLSTMNAREEATSGLLLEARRDMNTRHGWAERVVPAWTPQLLRPAAVRVMGLPADWATARRIAPLLDAREALLDQQACDDPAELMRRPRRVALRELLTRQPPVAGAVSFARTSRSLACLQLTRHVIATRAGLADPVACGATSIRQARAPDGRLTLVVSGDLPEIPDVPLPHVPASFTLEAPAENRPVLSSAPRP